MLSTDKHACMLPKQPDFLDIPPTAGFLEQICRLMHSLILPCEWHHGTALFIRSQKSFKRERERQKSSHWMVWHPYSPMKFYWDCFVMFLTLIIFAYVPMQVFFICPNPYDSLILFSDAIAFLDIAVKFITAFYNDKDKKVTFNLTEIAKSYLCGIFIFDLIGALPLQMIKLYDNCQYPSYTVFYILKLFRIIAFRRAWENLQQQLELSYIMTVILSVMGHTLIFFHWMTYIHFQVPNLCAHIYELDPDMLEWLKRYSAGDLNGISVIHKYSTNMYYVSSLCIGAGQFSPVTQHFIPEMILTAGISLIGLFFITYAFMALFRLVIYEKYAMNLYNGRLKELEQYMKFKKLPKHLQQRVMMFMNYKFNGRYYNEVSIVNTLNDQIQQDINMYCCKRLVMRVPMFQDLPDAVINTIIFSLKQVYYMPGELVVKSGESRDGIYLIASGNIAVFDSRGKEVFHLSDGAYFGEKALMHPGTPREGTVITLEITEIYKLSSEQYLACLLPYPQLKRHVESVYTQYSAF